MLIQPAKKRGLGEVQVAGKGSPLLIPVIHFSPQIGHHVDMTKISTKLYIITQSTNIYSYERLKQATTGTHMSI